MLDEIDKLGMDFRGDPASALLEVLDPEQNSAFRDHYLDVAFDLSKVLFITTANVLDTVPAPLRDRMEIIEIAGYTEEEKVQIARRHLVPKQTGEHGLEPDQIRWSDDALRLLVRSYTREAGLRNLEREIATITRKVAKRRVEGNDRPRRRPARPRRGAARRARVRAGGARRAHHRARRRGGARVDARRRRHPLRRGRRG